MPTPTIGCRLQAGFVGVFYDKAGSLAGLAAATYNFNFDDQELAQRSL